MTRLLMIRHGETDWNVEGRWQGQADIPLNRRGRQQAVIAARSLCHTDIRAIYSSDLQRAWKTAGILGRIKNLPVRRDARLREIHQGEWQGLLIGEIQMKYAHEFRRRHDNPMLVAPPGGETALQVRDRVLSALNDITKEHPADTVAVVSHGFVIAIARTHFSGQPIDDVWGLVPENGTVIELELTNEVC